MRGFRRDAAASHGEYYPPSDPAGSLDVEMELELELELENQGRTHDRGLPTALHPRSCPQSKATDPAISEMQTPQAIRPALNLGGDLDGEHSCWHRTLLGQQSVSGTLDSAHCVILPLPYYLHISYIYVYWLDPIYCVNIFL